MDASEGRGAPPHEVAGAAGDRESNQGASGQPIASPLSSGGAPGGAERYAPGRESVLRAIVPDERGRLEPALRWTTLLPLALILLSLLTLVGIPVLIQRRAEALRDQISDTAEPAHELTSEIGIALGLEMAGTRGFLLTGDERYAERHAMARAARTSAEARLLPLARALGPRFADEVTELGRYFRSSDVLLDSLYAGDMSRAAYVARLGAQQARFEGGIAAVGRLGTDIVALMTARRAEIRGFQRATIMAMAFPVFLALVAAALVGRLGYRYRVLALQFDLEARQEAALRTTARMFNEATSVQDVVQTVVASAVATTHAFGAYVERIEQATPDREVEVMAAAGAGTPPVGTRVGYPGSLTEAIVQSGEPEILTDMGAIGERMAPYLRASCERCSGLIVPLTSERRVTGAMVLLRDPASEHFAPAEVAHARALGDLASAALRRVVLLEALGESEERFRQIAENIREFIWLSDPHLVRQYYASSGYERIWGRTPQSLYDDPESAIRNIHPDDRERVMAAARSGESPRGHFDIEYRVVRPDGEIRWVRSRGFPVRNARGELFRIAGITEDITERKQIEMDRERLLQSEQTAREAYADAYATAERRRGELARVTESRARLLRGFTHDVKNPLGAADGYLALLEDGILGELTARQKEGIAGARRSIGVALDLIRDLLDLARAEAGELEVERVRMDACTLAQDVAEAYRATAESAGLTLEIDLPERLPEVESDPARVRQILANLITNAIKYTPEGGHVAVRAAVRSDGTAPRSGAWIAVDVADTGPGISGSEQAMLFEEFSRLNPGVAQGAGIGLAISQRLAHALGGAISVESEVGVGSTFTLWLPVEPAEGREERDARAAGE